jgi:hypothetical protein
MHEGLEEQDNVEGQDDTGSSYFLENGAEQDLEDLVRAKPELADKIQEDLDYIGRNPETGTSTERVDRDSSGNHSQQWLSERSLAHLRNSRGFSDEQVEKLKISRVYTRPEEYSIYWVVRTLEEGVKYPVVWWIDWNEENQDPVAVPRVVQDMFRGVNKEVYPGEG